MLSMKEKQRIDDVRETVEDVLAGVLMVILLGMIYVILVAIG